MESRIRSSRISTLFGVLALTAVVTLPVVMLASFPWVTRAQVARVIGIAPAEAQPTTMAFEPEVITLAEADVVSHRCSPTTDETGAPIAVAEPTPRFVPICDREVGPIGDLAVAANR